MEQAAKIPFMDVEMYSTSNCSMISFPLDNLLIEIIDDRNLSESFDDLIGNLENKHQREYHRKKKEETLITLKKELSEGKFHLERSELKELHVDDGYKPRIVQAPPVYKRIGVQAIMRIVEKYIYPTLITNTAASIKGRGMHWLHHIVKKDIKTNPENMQFYGQSDVYHFYDSIDQDKMKSIIREYIADCIVLKYLDNFIELMPFGLSKGLRSSQALANLYLSAVDKIMCQHVNYHIDDIEDNIPDGHEIHYHYYRYCDDIVFFAPNKFECWKLYNLLNSELTKLGLKIKENFAIRPISEGLDFLGFKTFGAWKTIKGEKRWNVHSLLRKRIKSRKRRQQVIGSFKGMACHADCKNLYHKLTGQHMAKFSELGLIYTPKDGKKRFNCQHMTLGQIANRPLEILDFEKDIKTRWGESRYLVLFHFIGEITEYKFYTDSEEMKFYLDKMKEQNLFPVETTIVQRQGTGSMRIYSFT